MKNKGLKILLSVLLVLCIIMAGALIGKEYIGDNIKEASNRNGVDVVRDTSDAGKAEDNALTIRHLLMLKLEKHCFTNSGIFGQSV